MVRTLIGGIGAPSKTRGILSTLAAGMPAPKMLRNQEMGRIKPLPSLANMNGHQGIAKTADTCAPPPPAGTKGLCTAYSKPTAGQGMGQSPQADALPLKTTPAAGTKPFSAATGQWCIRALITLRRSHSRKITHGNSAQITSARGAPPLPRPMATFSLALQWLLRHLGYLL